MPAVYPRKKILVLYRSFMRLASSWPLEEALGERNMKWMMVDQIRNKFKEAKLEKDHKQIQMLVKFGERELRALQILQSNLYAVKYPYENFVIPQEVNRAEYLLTDDAQKKMIAGKWGLRDRWKEIKFEKQKQKLNEASK